MIRSHGEDQYAVSLFPMFNILIALLGCLIFILGTVATLTLGVNKTVSITLDEGDTSSRKHRKIPHYIEWDGTRLITYPDKYVATFDRNLHDIKTYKKTYTYIESIISGTPIEQHFEYVKEHRKTEYLVVLTRPSGFRSLREIRGYIEHLGVDIGYEPVSQGWTLQVRR